jgi:phosphomannomutase / phosphoglucomutase
MRMKMNPVIFREYDIRGVVDQDFDAGFATALGRAYATYMAKEHGKHQPTIALGYDARHSSPKLAQALATGLKNSGANVVHLGLVTSPISYFATFAVEKVQGALMVTGSHNPPHYNGFKVSVGQATIFGEEIKKLQRYVEAGDFISGDGKEEHLDIFPQYVRRYQEEFGQIENLPVVLDCGNGAAGCIVRRLYEAVGLRPTILFEEPDGRFPNHHPDPTVAENLTELIREVRKQNARVGIGFDGDADRIGIVDDQGNMVYGDELLALCGRFILEQKPGQKIIGDVKCSDRIFQYIAKYGGQPIMWKTGHSLIKEKIKVEKAPFGGELSGHIFFADRNYGYDDALYAGLRVVEILAKTGKTIGELLKDLPKAYNTPEIRIDTTEEKKHSIVERLKAEFARPTEDFKVNLIDGIRVSFANGWALARASNTQPVLVLRFEADSPEALQSIRQKFEKIIQPLL